MTLLPSESWDVKILELPRYAVGPRCCVPGCDKLADHAHHLWRRSFTGRPATWVRIGNTTFGNLVAICFEHHEQVTRNAAWIRMVDDFEGWTFTWNTLEMDGWVAHGPIEPQPPLNGVLGPAPISAPEKPGEEHTVERGEELPPCPTCGHKRRATPKVDLPPGERRPRVSWTISVPKDERENGADVLDTLLAESAKILGRDEHVSWKYFTAVEALAAFVQHGHLMVGEQ